MIKNPKIPARFSLSFFFLSNQNILFWINSLFDFDVYKMMNEKVESLFSIDSEYILEFSGIK